MIRLHQRQLHLKRHCVIYLCGERLKPSSDVVVALHHKSPYISKVFLSRWSRYDRVERYAEERQDEDREDDKNDEL